MTPDFVEIWLQRAFEYFMEGPPIEKIVAKAKIQMQPFFGEVPKWDQSMMRVMPTPDLLQALQEEELGSLVSSTFKSSRPAISAASSTSETMYDTSDSS